VAETCARCKAGPIVIGSRCMKCRIRECAIACGLNRYMWWQRVEPAFVALMIGRYLNDGRGAEPPSVEDTLRGLRILARAKQYRRLDEITALIEMVDRARRKRADSVRNDES
jgi:hypothetical protein